MRLTELKNHERELYYFQLRIGAAGIAVLIAFGVLLARFVYLQVVQGEYYRTKAEDNRISIVPIAPNRGLIKDRNGVVLARNYSAYTLEIMPAKVASLENTINSLAEIVDIQPRDRARFKKVLAETRNAESVPIRTRLTDEEVAKFAANRYRFSGVEIKARLFRQYPFEAVASHVVGYIGRINDKDAEKLVEAGLDANYRGTDFIGKMGLEGSYQNELHGTTGIEQVEIDAGGRGIRTLSRTPALPGNDLTLALDIKLQQVAENTLGNRRGAVVALDPTNGGVLAFVSRPGFDPNLFVDGIDPQSWSELNNSPDRPLTNRAINGQYPPGSTIKPFLALAALESGKRRPSQSISDPGFFDFGGRRFRDDKVGGHGVVDMYKAIVESCDTYYYVLSNDMGIDLIAKTLAPFGYGSRTGIDLEGESAGILPSPEWKRKRFRKPEQQKWYAGETISIGIGQGYHSYTPLQLAQAVAAIANNGVVFKPRLVNHIDNQRTNVRRTLEPAALPRVPMQQEHVDFIKRAMGGVNTGGTGARVFKGAEYTSGGKTGTAQVIAIKAGEKYVEKNVAERHRDHSLFIAFAPLDSPKIALAVIVENGGFGSVAAAPIARALLDYYLLGKVPPENQPLPGYTNLKQGEAD
jgi:penicillin-binding protein 2